MSSVTQARDGARERMITGAIELFRAHGVAGTSLADIVQHSKSPRGSLYHYFPEGKAQLAEEATGVAGELLSSSLASLLEAKGPERAIRVLINSFRRALVETDFGSGCPVAAGALEGGESEGARAVAGGVFSAWESLITAALKARDVPADRAEGLATLSVTAIEGSLIVAKAQRSTQALDRTEVQLAALLKDL